VLRWLAPSQNVFSLVPLRHGGQWQPRRCGTLRDQHKQVESRAKSHYADSVIRWDVKMMPISEIVSSRTHRQALSREIAKFSCFDDGMSGQLAWLQGVRLGRCHLND